ncbi:MAG: cell wall metabolism sensor histidine kinase WalK [Gemmataceae bacterium]|nr:cell wall metabolism sensor histidine kinase WalK [Gemmataceae bacterium]
MFWRLFLTYLLLVVIAVGVVGFVLFRNTEPNLAGRLEAVGVAVLLVVAVAAAPAYLMARRFARPLEVLADGARRLADGDLGHKIEVNGGRAHAALAATFNAMSDRLAATFAQIAHDREQLRAILGGMVEGVVAIGPDRRVLFANGRAGELLGFDPDAAAGRPVGEVARPRAFAEAVEKGLAGPGPHRDELDDRAAARTLAVYVSRFAGPDEPGAVAVVHDTTDLRRLERVRQEFVANVSHELKTPLAVIRSAVEALGDGAADDPADRAQFLGIVAAEAVRLDALTRDLLSLARLDAGDLGLELGPVPLDKAILDCLDRHQARAEEKTLTLVEKPPAAGPADLPALADPGALRQVLDNLVDNAIKYTPNGGRITVRWDAEGGAAVLEVADTGVGIPAADQARVFERFYRADKARTRGVGGTGLGLAIVKHLVQAMRGTVRVASAEGQGTTFRITLPRADGG